MPPVPLAARVVEVIADLGDSATCSRPTPKRLVPPAGPLWVPGPDPVMVPVLPAA
jgi:hypothetical protein